MRITILWASAFITSAAFALDFNAPIEKLAGGFQFTENPVWVAANNELLFSDIPADRIIRFKEGKCETFRSPSHNSNGLTLDKQGRLIACEHGSRRVTRTEPDGRIVTLADRFEGKRLNSPNDAVVKSHGAIYFTDLQRAANGDNFGLRADGRFYPYSTPQGRRIGWRQPVWDKALFAKGCTKAEAEQRLRADLERMLAAVRVAYPGLDQRQEEMLLDFAHSEGIGNLKTEFVAAVLAKDWERIVKQHLYVRYAGHAPDHVRNKAFAAR